jgi:UDP-N-acetylglucosamine 2-epimerase (non-hydrolysing)
VHTLFGRAPRDEERKAGTVKPVGTAHERIVASARIFVDDLDKGAAMAGQANPYGDGKAAERIVEVVGRFLEEAGR